MELRYRFLRDGLIRHYSNGELTEDMKKELGAEISVLDVLIKAARGQGQPASVIENEWSKRHSDLIAAGRILTEGGLRALVKAGLPKHVTDNIVLEAEQAWQKWHKSVSPPFTVRQLELSYDTTTSRTYAPIGPFPIEQMPGPPVLDYGKENTGPIIFPSRNGQHTVSSSTGLRIANLQECAAKKSQRVEFDTSDGEHDPVISKAALNTLGLTLKEHGGGCIISKYSIPPPFLSKWRKIWT